jgi:hypothetical protein
MPCFANVWRSIRSHSSGRLFDRRWIVILVVDDARTMTLGTGDDVAVSILDSALAMTLRTDFHVALSRFRVDNLGFLRHQRHRQSTAPRCRPDSLKPRSMQRRH